MTAFFQYCVMCWVLRLILLRQTSTLVSDQLESQASGQPLLSSLSRTGSMNVSFSSLPFARLTVSEKRKEICRVADNALASFIIIHAALKRTADIQKYSLRDDLNKRMPNFAVKMGFGLHVGWAIEGAIGSEYKVDASYLSPNVNMASRLEAATKQFGTSILLSNDFVRCLSQQVNNCFPCFREIDKLAFIILEFLRVVSLD